MTDPIKTALEALRIIRRKVPCGAAVLSEADIDRADAAIAALEELEKAEPVLWLSENNEITGSKRKAEYWLSHFGAATPLFTHPAPVRAEPVVFPPPMCDSRELCRLQGSCLERYKTREKCTTPPAAPVQAEPVAPNGSGGWAYHAQSLEKERDYFRQQCELMRQHKAKDCWYWQGDGEDNLESMGNSMAVVIRADQLRALVKPLAAPVANSALMTAQPEADQPLLDGLRKISRSSPNISYDMARVVKIAQLALRDYWKARNA